MPIDVRLHCLSPSEMNLRLWPGMAATAQMQCLQYRTVETAVFELNSHPDRGLQRNCMHAKRK
jgi:hypothetical protein